MPPNARPSSFTSPQWPSLMPKAPAASQRPYVGKALNWHGQPYEQLQLTNSVALISQGVMADLPSALGFTFYDTIKRCDAAATVIFVAAIQSRRYAGNRSGTSDLCLPTHVYADRLASIPTTIAYRSTWDGGSSSACAWRPH